MAKERNGNDAIHEFVEPLGEPHTFNSLFAIPGNRLSLTANRMVQDFTITTDSYVLLCTHLYEVLCAENHVFADKISESAFQYYAIMLLWQRLCQFLPPRSCKSSPFLNKLSYFEPHLTGIPIPLEIYLKGIGNFEHPNLGEMRFTLPEILFSEKFDLTTGVFGKVSADTHFLYEAFPAPGIAALRILADIGKTNSFVSDTNWDLPEDIRPDVKDQTSVEGEAKFQLPRPMPTKNLLGWSPAQILTTKQLELFRTLGIEGNVPQNDLSKFFDNSTKLLATISGFFDVSQKVQNVQIRKGGQVVKVYDHILESVSDRSQSDCDNSEDEIEEARIISKKTMPEIPSQINDRFDCLEGFTKVKRLPFKGSTIQSLSVMKTTEPSEFDRCRMYCDGMVSVSSSYNANENMVAGAVITGYRMPKEPIMRNRHSWCCYDFNKYDSVPQSWISTRNLIYTFKDVEGLNKPAWTTGTTDKRLTQYSFLKKHLLANEDNWNVYM